MTNNKKQILNQCLIVGSTEFRVVFLGNVQPELYLDLERGA